MKKIFQSLAVTVVSSFAFINYTAAQNDLGINEEDMPELSKPLIINVPADSLTCDHLIHVNERALKNFQKKFPGAIDPYWYEVFDGFIASFKKDSVTTKVAYDKKGRLQYAINYYGEKMMPRELRHIVKSVYYDYSIVSVAEVHLNEPDAQTTYVVCVGSCNSFKILTASDYEILSVKDWKRI